MVGEHEAQRPEVIRSKGDEAIAQPTTVTGGLVHHMKPRGTVRLNLSIVDSVYQQEDQLAEARDGCATGPAASRRKRTGVDLAGTAAPCREQISDKPDKLLTALMPRRKLARPLERSAAQTAAER